MSLLGDRVPLGAKVFFSTLAIADDLFAIVVIALFYSTSVKSGVAGRGRGGVPGAVCPQQDEGLPGHALRDPGCCAVAVLLLLGRARHARRRGAGLCPALAHRRAPAELHRLAGLQGRRHRRRLRQLRARAGAAQGHRACPPARHGLPARHPAAAARGARHLGAGELHHPARVRVRERADQLRGLRRSLAGRDPDNVTVGVYAGAVLGKPIGIMLTTLAMVHLFRFKLPDGVRWGHIMGVGILGGIGFTMSSHRAWRSAAATCT